MTELDLARKLVEDLREPLRRVSPGSQRPQGASSLNTSDDEEYLWRFSIRSKVVVPNATGSPSTSVTEILRNSGRLPGMNADSSDSDDLSEWIEVLELPTKEVQEIDDYI